MRRRALRIRQHGADVDGVVVDHGQEEGERAQVGCIVGMICEPWAFVLSGTDLSWSFMLRAYFASEFRKL